MRRADDDQSTGAMRQALTIHPHIRINKKRNHLGEMAPSKFLLLKPQSESGNRLSIPAAMPAGVTLSFLFRDSPLLGRLRKRHVLAIDAQYAATVNRTLETAQRPIDRFLISYLNSDCQSDSPLE